MKNLYLALVMLITLLAPRARAADANPPGKMTFQGFLTDAGSPPVPLGNASPENKTVIFKIYRSATGTASTDVLWAESQVVTVDKGHFSVLLGEGSSVSGLPHNVDLSGVFAGADASDRWMGITVDGAEITPRIQFFAAPYAQLARTANTLMSGATIGSVTATSDVTATGHFRSQGANSGVSFQDRANAGGETPWTFYSDGGIARLWRSGDKVTFSDTGRIGAAGLDISGTSTLAGNVGIGTSSSGAKLDVYGNVTAAGSVASSGSVAGLIFNNRQGGSSWQWYSDDGTARLWNGSDRLVVTSEGNVGIGAGSPAVKLEVSGTAKANSLLSTANVSTHEQGAWLEWNKDSSGMTYLLNQKGLGTGGILFGEVSAANVVTERMRISSSGNVGIGTANPAVPLHVNGSARIEGASVLEFGGGVSGKESNAGKIGYATFSSGALDIIGAGAPSASRLVRVWDRLGIGTATPTVPLHVVGGVAHLFLLDGVLGTGGAGDHYENRSDLVHSIVANNRIRAASFDVESDARIKQVTGRTSGQDSLQAIRKLQVTDYAYIDKITHGPRPQRGLIAQEVSEVLPQAVGQSVGIVPNIYALASSWEFDAAKQQLSVELKNAHQLKTGDVVALILGDSPAEAKILETPSSATFVIAAAERPTRLFVIGKQVKDFRTVDYDLVFTTGLSALQELDRQVQALKQSQARIAELEQKTSRLAELEEKAARVDSLEREMADLKKLVAGLAQAQAGEQVSARKVAARINQ